MVEREDCNQWFAVIRRSTREHGVCPAGSFPNVCCWNPR